jgi:hypothetical protein
MQVMPSGAVGYFDTTTRFSGWPIGWAETSADVSEAEQIVVIYVADRDAKSARAKP